MRESDLQECRALLRSGSRSFYAASFLLPERVRDPATALYAFCRIADDVIDLSGGDGRAIAELRQRVTDAYAGKPHETAYDRAFAAAVATHSIPQALPEALLEGFAWDVEQRRYETIEDVLSYAARVAGTVGAMMCLLMDRRDAPALARASELGMAMQLSNIARDVGEDARNGRIYLPLSWCREEGLDVDGWMAKPVFDEKIARIVARLLATADELYSRADRGIAVLPGDCRRGIRAARLLYAEIGSEVARQSFDSVSRRAVVSGRRKAGVLARAVLPSSRAVADHGYALLEASRFLVDAAARDATFLSAKPHLKWWDLYGQALHVIALFDALERRQRDVPARTVSGRNLYAGATESP